MSRKDLDSLLAYLAENSGRHSIEALQGQILKAGHSPADADRAIAVYQGRMPPPEAPVWWPALLVAVVDFALGFLCYELFSRQGTGKVSCAALALIPGLYLAELLASFILLAGGKERWGRALLLGLLIFFAMVALTGFVILVRWLSKVTGS
jgi:hypothetical protein